MDYHRRLYESYVQIRPFFDSIIKENKLSENHMSDFWKERLDARDNFPKFNELLIFRRKHAASIGYDKVTTIEKERIKFLSNFDRAILNIPEKFLIDNQESLIGNPFVFSKNTILSSSAGINNAVSAYWALSSLNFRTTSNLGNVLEIGAGYGGVAELILRNKKPKKYVICDLPHNLYLTAFFLSANHPNYQVCFSPQIQALESHDNQIILCTPEDIVKINLEYDFIINTYSFQEMRKEDISLYFDYISNNISNKGIFYFLNTFGGSGAKTPLDYPFQKFDILSWGPAKAPQANFFLKRQHAECIMTKKSTDQDFKYFDMVSYPIHLLFFAGLGDQLTELCSKLFNHTIDENDLHYFKTVEKLLSDKSPLKSIDITDNLREFENWKMITYYLEGLLLLIVNKKEKCEHAFINAMDEGLIGLAKTRALFALAIINGYSNNSKTADKYIDLAIQNTPQYETQLQSLNRNFDTEQFINLFRYTFPNMSNFRKRTTFKNLFKNISSKRAAI